MGTDAVDFGKHLQWDWTPTWCEVFLDNGLWTSWRAQEVKSPLSCPPSEPKDALPAEAVTETIDSSLLNQWKQDIYVTDAWYITRRQWKLYLDDFLLFINGKEIRNFSRVQQTVDILQKAFFLYLSVAEEKDGSYPSLSGRQEKFLKNTCATKELQVCLSTLYGKNCLWTVHICDVIDKTRACTLSWNSMSFSFFKKSKPFPPDLSSMLTANNHSGKSSYYRHIAKQCGPILPTTKNSFWKRLPMQNVTHTHTHTHARMHARTHPHTHTHKKIRCMKKFAKKTWWI